MSEATYATIERFPGYRFGDDGSAWTCWKRRGGGRWGHPVVLYQSTEWKRMAPYPASKGHLLVALYRDGKRHRHPLHALILEAFRGPAPAGQEGCHNNGRPSDNWLDNLRWDTRKGNLADRYKHGTMPIGEKSKRAKLTNLQAEEIRRLHAAGWHPQKLAAQFNVSRGTIHNVVKFITYFEKSA